MFDSKIEELRAEYTDIINKMKLLSDEYNTLDKRKTEIEGAYKILMELKGSNSNEGLENDSQDRIE